MQPPCIYMFASIEGWYLGKEKLGYLAHSALADWLYIFRKQTEQRFGQLANQYMCPHPQNWSMAMILYSKQLYERQWPVPALLVRFYLDQLNCKINGDPFHETTHPTSNHFLLIHRKDCQGKDKPIARHFQKIVYIRRNRRNNHHSLECKGAAAPYLDL